MSRGFALTGNTMFCAVLSVQVTGQMQRSTCLCLTVCTSYFCVICYERKKESKDRKYKYMTHTQIGLHVGGKINASLLMMRQQ